MMKNSGTYPGTYHVDFIDATNGDVVEYDDITAYSLKDAKKDAQKLKTNTLDRLLNSGRYPHLNAHKLRTIVKLRRF
jgi:hypothetical protein